MRGGPCNRASPKQANAILPGPEVLLHHFLPVALRYAEICGNGFCPPLPVQLPLPLARGGN